MIVEIRAVGPFFKNGFVLGCVDTREAVLIDPGDEVQSLLAFAERQTLTIRHILLTHAHVDHVTGVAAAKRALGVPIHLHVRRIADSPDRRRRGVALHGSHRTERIRPGVVEIENDEGGRVLLHRGQRGGRRSRKSDGDAELVRRRLDFRGEHEIVNNGKDHGHHMIVRRC